jgi:hypothetical protein
MCHAVGGLLTLSEDQATGEIRLSTYGVATILNYPAGARRIRLGFYAFEITNDAAQTAFRGALDSETHVLRSLPAWPPQADNTRPLQP